MKRQYATFFLMPVLANRKPIEWGAASHPHTHQLQDQGVLKFIFANILLPDSNVNEPLSHSFVSFRIKPNLPLLPGDQITNIANIYFDFNPPVITEPSVLVAEFSTGMEEPQSPAKLLVMPNPTEGRLMVRKGGDDLRTGMLNVRGIDGRSMLEQRMPGTSATINVEALYTGVYMLEFLTDDGSRSTVRFVKR